MSTKIKRRYINKNTGQHGVQLKYYKLLELVADIADNYMFNALTVSALLSFTQELDDLAYAYNLAKYPVKKIDEPGKKDLWIIGFNKVQLTSSSNGAFVIEFKTIDNHISSSINLSKP